MAVIRFRALLPNRFRPQERPLGAARSLRLPLFSKNPWHHTRQSAGEEDHERRQHRVRDQIHSADRDDQRQDADHSVAPSRWNAAKSAVRKNDWRQEKPEGGDEPDDPVDAQGDDPESVRDMFNAVGEFDALISAVGGDSTFKQFTELNDDDYRYGFERKFLSQIRLLKIGKKHIRDIGSFTFTSGFLSEYPNPFSSSIIAIIVSLSSSISRATSGMIISLLFIIYDSSMLFDG